jgi:transcriptional regulator with XRE-family HTH domain
MPTSPVTHPKVNLMTRTPEKNFLRAWREYRRMTQAQLAESVDTTGAVISLLEAGHRGLSDKWLRKLAPVLGTSPGHLLDVDPNDVSSDILEIWAGVPENSREQVLNIIKTFTVLHDPKTKPSVSDEAQKPKAARNGKGPKGV